MSVRPSVRPWLLTIARTWAGRLARLHEAGWAHADVQPTNTLIIFIPVGACWINLQEGWWHIFRKTALAGRSFGDPDHITHTTKVATDQLNSRARPWTWGRPAPPTRRLRRRYAYFL